jgi:hypothetical protein
MELSGDCRAGTSSALTVRYVTDAQDMWVSHLLWSSRLIGAGVIVLAEYMAYAKIVHGKE